MMVRKASGKRNKAAKIEAIIETTRKLIGEKGYTATTTNHIAKAAGVSIGLVYKYFPLGKANITYQISLRDHFSIVETVLNAGNRKEELPKRLHSMLLAWITQHESNEPFLRAMNIAMLEKPQLFGGYSEVVKRTAEKGQFLFQPGEVEDSNNPEVRETMLALFHTIESTVHRHVLLIRMFDTNEKLAEFLSAVVLGVIRQYFGDAINTHR
jgi:AcrR family transcriptional regulator